MPPVGLKPDEDSLYLKPVRRRNAYDTEGLLWVHIRSAISKTGNRTEKQTNSGMDGGMKTNRYTC